jgi:hypothetical protein
MEFHIPYNMEFHILPLYDIIIVIYYMESVVENTTPEESSKQKIESTVAVGEGTNGTTQFSPRIKWAHLFAPR